MLKVAIESVPPTGHSWIDVLSALLTPLIAVIAAIIAFQQYRVNHLRLKHELYERRLRVYKAVQSFLSDVVRKGGIDMPRCAEFYRDASEATFLFDSTVQAYVEEIYDKGIDLLDVNDELYPADGAPGLPVGTERGAAAQKKNELLKWFTVQLEKSKSFFHSKMAVK